MKKHIAGFFTGGYTELYALRVFFSKINSELNIRQLCPHAQRKSKEDILSRKQSLRETQIDKSHSGLTGESLVDYICQIVKTPSFQAEMYDAILIEDDKDNRFLTVTDDGYSEINPTAWNEFKDDSIEKIHQAIRDIQPSMREANPEIPIIFFFAAPEVEAWMISDWDNGFGSIFPDSLPRNKVGELKHEFKRVLEQNVLTPQYKDQLESYGFFDRKYVKLSEKIQKSLMSEDSFVTRVLPPETGFDYSSIHYSKKITGEKVLYQLVPEKVLIHCTFFFKEGYYSLKAL